LLHRLKNIYTFYTHDVSKATAICSPEEESSSFRNVVYVVWCMTLRRWKMSV